MSSASVPSPVNYSPLVDELVTQWYLNTTFDNTVRKRIMADYMKKNGTMKMANGGGGKYLEIKAHVGEFTAAYRAEMTNRNFARVNHDVTYTAPYSFYEVLGVLSEEDIAFFSTRQAIVDLNKQILTRMSDDMSKGLNGQFLKSNATANTVAGMAAAATSPLPIYGLPTIFGYGATAIGYNPTTQASTTSAVSAADLEVLPNVSYCGVSTHPTNAISGVDNKLNESTSPIIANWSSTGFNATASSTYRTNCLSVISHINTRLQSRSNDTDMFPDIALQTATMHNDFKAALRASTSQQIVFGEAPIEPDVGLFKRLFVRYEGLAVFVDVDMPSNVLYVLNTKNLNFHMFPQMPAGMPDGKLGGTVDPIFRVSQMPDIDTGAHKSVAKIAGQLVANPRCQAMAYNFG